MKRIYSLDVLKLYFAYVVAFFHFGTDLSPGPEVSVQIFFIISGFFLGRKYYTRSHGKTDYDSWHYTLDHVKSLYPHYVLSYLAFVLYETARALVYLVKAPAWEGLQEMLLRFYDQIPNLLCLQSAYYFHDNMNYPVWQISALVIGGFFVYGLLCYNENLSRKLVFPAAILMIQSLLASETGLFSRMGPFYMPLLRAFSPLCIGVLTYYFTTTEYFAKLRSKKVLFNLGVLLVLPSILLFQKHGSIFLITTPLLILGCYAEDSWINLFANRRCFRHFGKLSYAIFLNHALVIRFVQARLLPRLQAWGLDFPQWQQACIYFVLLTVYSVLTLSLVELWRSRRVKKVTV